MAANMQHMAGANQMMGQQMRRPQGNQLSQYIFQRLIQTPPLPQGSWQTSVSNNERLSKAGDLITNIALAMPGTNTTQVAEIGCKFEQEAFMKCPSKEAYDAQLRNKVQEFHLKRQENEPNLQNNLNANAQAQAQARAQAVMSMQMGRGMNMQHGFQPMQQQQPQQQPMQAAMMMQQQPHPQQNLQQAQQAQMRQPQPAQTQQGMGMNMGMGMGQAGRGMPPNQQLGMGMQGPPNQQMQRGGIDMSRLNPADRAKVHDLSTKMSQQASEEQKATLRQLLERRLGPQMYSSIGAEGKDPVMWYYQNQAIQVLRRNADQAGQQGRPPNQSVAQAPMMQQRPSQQGMQQSQAQQQQPRPNMTGAVQQGGDVSHFGSNMESIKDQQLNGLMAQQAGQMVVPASNPATRNSTPQSMNQNMPNQMGPNQTPRPQSQQQMPQQQTPQQLQQQMKLNQQSQSQMQAQAQMKQMQGIPNNQSPGMNNLNAPPARPGNGMGQMGNQPMGAANGPLGDRRFNQGVQRPNNQAFSHILAQMTPEQRNHLSALPQEQLQEVLRRMQRGQLQQQQLGVQGRPGQNGHGMPQQPQQMQMQQPQVQHQPGQVPQQQQPQPQQPQGPGGPQNAKVRQMMDSMELPPHLEQLIGALPAHIKKWAELKAYMSQGSLTLPPNVYNQLLTQQHRQFQLAMARRASTMRSEPQMPNMGPGGPQMQNQQGQNLQGRQAGQMAGRPPFNQNIPQHLLQVTPQELASQRARNPQLAQMPEDQLRSLIMNHKREVWHRSQQQMQMSQQGAATAQAQVPRPNAMTAPQAPMGMPPSVQMPQQAPPQAHNSGALPMGQTASMPSAMQNQANNGPAVAPVARQPTPANRGQVPTPSPAQPTRNLKRPSNDEAADNSNAARAGGGAARGVVQPPTAFQGNRPRLTALQLASLSPDQRMRYEQMLKDKTMASARQGSQSAPEPQSAPGPSGEDAKMWLRKVGTEELQRLQHDSLPILNLTSTEQNEVIRVLGVLGDYPERLLKAIEVWYRYNPDEKRLREFFRARFRIQSHYESNGGSIVSKGPKTVFRFNVAETARFKILLESIASDMSKKKRPQQAFGAQSGATPAKTEPQQNNAQSQPPPLSEANLEQNTRALGNKGKKPPARNAQPATVAANTQPQFGFNGVVSPHGTPGYPGQPPEMTLTLPPRKKQKVQTGSAKGSGSPAQTGKPESPEVQRAAEPQPPPKPMLQCKDFECEGSTQGFLNDKALQKHVEEEHTKPRENPARFARDMLAIYLGIDAEAVLNKNETAPAMSATNSRQGQTPGNLIGTPVSQDGAMRSATNNKAKPTDGSKPVSKTSDGKQVDDSWQPDAALLLKNLGFEDGLPVPAIMDVNAFKLLTPKDTPESSKDGASEPSSDIPDNSALDIDLNWSNLDNDVMFSINKSTLDENDMDAMDAIMDSTLAIDGPDGAVPDWDNFESDFSKPFQFDNSLFSFDP